MVTVHGGKPALKLTGRDVGVTLPLESAAKFMVDPAPGDTKEGGEATGVVSVAGAEANTSSPALPLSGMPVN